MTPIRTLSLRERYPLLHHNDTTDNVATHRRYGSCRGAQEHRNKPTIHLGQTPLPTDMKHKDRTHPVTDYFFWRPDKIAIAARSSSSSVSVLFLPFCLLLH
mmetsp:Transcript_39186/g.92247  ORF Transcript_39186/g.92247 Transcript_39186/m.92247 type:complete len:101 (+) Transcript_39186:118-420(+)